MIRTAGPGDLPALRELFAIANDAPYDLAAVAEEKCFGTGIAGMPVVRVLERDGRLAGAAVTCGKWLRILAVAPAARRRGDGAALLADAEALGARVAAAEPGNYFTPGILASDGGTGAFLRARGYGETTSTWNLHVSLNDAASTPPPGSVRVAHDDAARVLDFIESEFGRIWRFETAKAFEHDVPTLFIAEEGGAVCGFAAYEANNRGLGAFGPAGVASGLRGRGIGTRLLRAALGGLRAMGYERAVIPWTDALDFYRNASGAEPAHRFVAFARLQP